MHFKGLMIAVQTLDGEAGKKRRAKAYLRTYRKVQTYQVNSVIISYNKFRSGYLKSLCMKTANKLFEYKVHSFEFKRGFAAKVHLCSVIASFFVCGRLRNFYWRDCCDFGLPAFCHGTSISHPIPLDPISIFPLSLYCCVLLLLWFFKNKYNLFPVTFQFPRAKYTKLLFNYKGSLVWLCLKKNLNGSSDVLKSVGNGDNRFFPLRSLRNNRLVFYLKFTKDLVIFQGLLSLCSLYGDDFSPGFDFRSSSDRKSFGIGRKLGNRVPFLLVSCFLSFESSKKMCSHRNYFFNYQSLSLVDFVMLGVWSWRSDRGQKLPSKNWTWKLLSGHGVE